MATGFLKGAGSPEALDISHALSINYLISQSPTIAALPADPWPTMYLASYFPRRAGYHRRLSGSVKNSWPRSSIPIPCAIAHPIPGAIVRRLRCRARRASSSRIPTGTAHKRGIARRNIPQLGVPNGGLMARSFPNRSWAINNSDGNLSPTDSGHRQELAFL
jgi:hypothetical protein